MGRHLASRGVYNYVKDCGIVKSHKLSRIIERHCVSLWFMGALAEPDSEVSHGEFP